MCEITYDGGGYADVWRESNPRARKPYKCAECRTPIQPSERYRYHFSTTDGYASQVRMCSACAEIRDAFGEAHEFTPHPETFYDSLVECIVGERPRFPHFAFEGDSFASRQEDRDFRCAPEEQARLVALWQADHRKWKEETRQWRLGRAQIRLRRRAVKRMKT